MMRALALAALLTLTAGCSTATTQLDLKAACDAVAPIVREFGQVAPNSARFAEYAPKIKAVTDKASESARKVFEPLIAAMEKGNTFEMAGVNIGLQSVCKGAGSTAWN